MTVPHAKDWRRCQSSFQSVEAVLFGGAPVKRRAGAAQGGERGSDLGEAIYEAAVVVRQANEAAYVGARGWLSPLGDGRDLAGVHGDTGSRDDVTQKGDRGAAELTFGSLGEETVLAQDGEDLPNVGQVLLLGAAEHEDVIHVHLHEAAQHGG